MEIAVLTLVAGACLFGPWFIRQKKQAAVLCLLCLVTFLIAGLVPGRWISAAEDCPDPWPPTGYVSCGDNAAFVMLPAMLIFIGSLTRLIAKDFILRMLRRQGT